MEIPKGSRRDDMIVVVSLIVIILVLMCYGIYKGIKVEKLETQLSECQDEVPIPVPKCIKEVDETYITKRDYWTFKIKCDFGNYLQEYTRFEYGTEESCGYWLDFYVSESESCEIIE